jgi:hypothetical protein
MLWCKSLSSSETAVVSLGRKVKLGVGRHVGPVPTTRPPRTRDRAFLLLETRGSPVIGRHQEPQPYCAGLLGTCHTTSL